MFTQRSSSVVLHLQTHLTTSGRRPGSWRSETRTSAAPMGWQGHCRRSQKWGDPNHCLWLTVHRWWTLSIVTEHVYIQLLPGGGALGSAWQIDFFYVVKEKDLACWLLSFNLIRLYCVFFRRNRDLKGSGFFLFLFLLLFISDSTGILHNPGAFPWLSEEEGEGK